MNRDIAIIGFGNQGKAWAENLRDSGWNVHVFTRPNSRSKARAEDAGFSCEDLGRKLGEVPHIAVLIPDDAMVGFYSEYGEHLRRGQSLIFAHGFSLHFKTVPWPGGLDWILLAPKGIASAVREKYLSDSGVPAVVSVENDSTGQAWETLEAVANGLGCDRAGLYKGTAKDEVEADLFSEQALLCGGLPAMVAETYAVLIKNGVNPEVAYLECVHELAFMADLFHRRGISDTLRLASPTAQFGGLKGKNSLITKELRQNLEQMFRDIQQGTFTTELKKEASTGFQKTQDNIETLDKSSLENVGKDVRRKIFGSHDEKNKEKK